MICAEWIVYGGCLFRVVVIQSLSPCFWPTRASPLHGFRSQHEVFWIIFACTEEVYAANTVCILFRFESFSLSMLSWGMGCHTEFNPLPRTHEDIWVQK